MSVYNELDEQQLGVDKVATSPTAFALYNNPIAIAEGAAGAPRIRPAAVAGTEVAAGTARTVYLNPLEHRTFARTSVDQAALAFAWTVAQTGTIRLSLQHAKAGEDGDVDVQVFKNETLVQAWATSSTSFVTRIITSLAITAGDRLAIRHWAGASPDYARLINITIQTTGGHLWLLPYGMRVS